MQCKHCGQQTDEKQSGLCQGCGQPLGGGVYAPPEGYAYNQESGLYYKAKNDVDSSTGAPVRKIMWFDPTSGEYHPTTYPAPTQPDAAPATTAAPAVSEGTPSAPPAAPVAAEPPLAPPPVAAPDVTERKPVSSPVAAEPPPLAPPPPPQPVLQPVSPPPGFVLDAATGRYCTRINTASGQLITWFDPATNSYTQETVSAAPPTVAAAPAPASKKTTTWNTPTPPPKAKRSKGPLVAVLLAVLLLAGGGTAWYLGWFDELLAAPAGASGSASSTASGRDTSEASASSAAEQDELPIPKNFEMTVFPISQTQALIRVSGLAFKESYPPSLPGFEDGKQIYGWVVRFTEDYQLVIWQMQDTTTTSPVNIDDLPAFVMRTKEPGNNEMVWVEGSQVVVTRQDDLLELFVTLPDGVPIDFLTNKGYSFVHVYGNARYDTSTHTIADAASYTAAKADGIFITPALPDIGGSAEPFEETSITDVTGYTHNYDWYDHESAKNDELPGGKWLTENGRQALHLDWREDANATTVYLTIKEDGSNSVYTLPYDISRVSAGKYATSGYPHMSLTAKSPTEVTVEYVHPESGMMFTSTFYLVWARDNHTSFTAETAGASGTSVDNIYICSNLLGSDLEAYACPTLKLDSSNQFALTVNAGEGIIPLAGSYHWENSKLILSVAPHGYYGYAGDDAKTIVFGSKEDGSLVLESPQLGLASPGTVFEAAM